MAIETVQIRSQGAYDFATHYESLCALQNSVPVASVKAHLGVGVIDVNADKIRLSDWLPLLKTLKINKTLKCVALRSYYEMPWRKLAAGLDRRKVLPAASHKTPSVHSKEVTYQFCKALRQCLEVTQSLNYIELQGLTLRTRDVAELMKGVSRNFSLRHLSFERSPLEEKSVQVICEGMKNASSLTYLNLSGCGLTSHATEAIARVVKHQAMMRHNEAWKNSLRYRVPDLNCMPGMRRITLNHNPLLGDETAAIFADTLKDDLWLKAVDLQHCGLTETGAKALLEALRFNTTIVVLDVRNNVLVGRELIQKITEQVLLNAGNKSANSDAEYKWFRAVDPNGGEPGTSLRAPASRHAAKIALKSKAVLSNNGRKKGASRSFSSAQVQQHRGLPWRTAQRALLHKGAGVPPLSARSAEQWEDASSDEEESGSSSAHSGSTASSLASGGPRHTLANARAVTGEADLLTSTEPLTVDQLGGKRSSALLQSSDQATAAAEIRMLKVEVEQLRRQVCEEAAARRVAEEQVLEVSRENRRLRSLTQASSRKGGIEVDEDFLDCVERSFAQYHAFLDVLREAGLGKLIDVAGIGGPVPTAVSNATISIPAASRNDNGIGHEWLYLSASSGAQRDGAISGAPSATVGDSTSALQTLSVTSALPQAARAKSTRGSRDHRRQRRIHDVDSSNNDHPADDAAVNVHSSSEKSSQQASAAAHRKGRTAKRRGGSAAELGHGHSTAHSGDGAAKACEGPALEQHDDLAKKLHDSRTADDLAVPHLGSTVADTAHTGAVAAGQSSSSSSKAASKSAGAGHNGNGDASTSIASSAAEESDAQHSGS